MPASGACWSHHTLPRAAINHKRVIQLVWETIYMDVRARGPGHPAARGDWPWAMRVSEPLASQNRVQAAEPRKQAPCTWSSE
jgi:hypothetical protein